MLWYFFMIGRSPSAIECNLTIALTPMTTLSADQESCSARFTYQCILSSLIGYFHTLHCSCRNLESRCVATGSVSSTRGSCLSDPNAFTSDGQHERVHVDQRHYLFLPNPRNCSSPFSLTWTIWLFLLSSSTPLSSSHSPRPRTYSLT